MPQNLSGRLRRPASGIGRTEFPIDIDLEDFGTQSVQAIVPTLPLVARAAAEGAARAFAAGGGGYGGTGGRGPVYALPPPAAGGGGVPPSATGRGRGGGYSGDPRFSAYTRGSGFYGGRGGGFASIGAFGGRFGFGGAGYAALGLFGAGAIREVSQNLIEASAAFETFERTVRATEETSADAAVRWEELLGIAERTVGIDVAGLVQYNSQLRVIGVEASRVNAVLEGTTRSVSELGRGVHVTREALNQLTDGIVRNHLNVRDWRAIVSRVPQFLEAASIALGTTVRSLDDFRQGSEAANITISEGILRTMEQLATTAQGLQGTYVAAVDRFNEASFRLRATLGEELKDFFTPVISGLAEAMSSLNEALNETPEDRLRRLFERLNEVRGSRTIFGDNPREREALNAIRRFLRENPDALPDTSPGAFRAVEAQLRAAQRPPVERPTDRSVDYFQEFFSNPLYREEFLRQDLRRAGGDFAAQIEASEARVQGILQQIRDASPREFVDTEYLPSVQAVIEALERELDAEFLRLRVLREINTERERERRQLEALRRQSQIATERFTAPLQGYFGIGVGNPARTAEREARQERERQAAVSAFINRNIGYSGLGVGRDVGAQATLSAAGRRAQQQLDIEAATIATRRFIERNRGYAGILTDPNEARIPSQRELDQREAARFRELGRGRGRDPGLNRLVGEALAGGPEGFDTDALRQAYEDYVQSRIDGEREAQRAAARAARQYERLWERTFTNVADTAIEAIFNRNLSFGEALSSIAQSSLRDFASFYIRQLVGGDGGLGSLFGAGTAAGGGVALGGASLLFPQEFQNLLEGIGSELGRIPRLFHNPSADLAAQAAGADLRRAFSSDTPTGAQNSRDLTQNLVDGFERAGQRNQPSGDAQSGDLIIQVNIGENSDVFAEIAIGLQHAIDRGLVHLRI